MGNYAEAVKAGEQHELHSEYDKGLISHLDGKLFFALALFCHFSQLPKDKHKYYLKKLKQIVLFIEKYAMWCPYNYKAYSLLMASEFARFEHKNEIALELYEQTIKVAFQVVYY